jgi:hypothetical protein
MERRFAAVLLRDSLERATAGRMIAMRSVAMAAAILVIAVLALMPAQAQMGGGGGGGRHRQGGDEAKSGQKKPQVDEKAYKAALDRIPEPKEKYDPWGVARPASPDSKKAK